jgi:hypothetical protein
MKIIGISGKKQGGKSYLAKNLCELLVYSQREADTTKSWISPEIVCMADALKQVVIDCFVPPRLGMGLTPSMLDSDDIKKTELPCGHTIRYLLQQIGTDMFRGLWSDVWINAWKRRLCAVDRYDVKPSIVICPDVRFPNELKAIHDLGGVVIRLTRAPFADVDQHESETALDDVECYPCTDGRRAGRITPNFDFVMDNKDFSMDDARRWAKDFVAENYPDYV